jgi:hypothetical protein
MELPIGPPPSSNLLWNISSPNGGTQLRRPGFPNEKIENACGGAISPKVVNPNLKNILPDQVP